MKRTLAIISAVLFFASNGISQNADTSASRNHLVYLTKSSERGYLNTKRLDSVADYIAHHFKQYAQEVREQKFSVGGRIYRNVICSFGIEHNERIIVGAHYDVCGKQPGADDNEATRCR